MVCFSAHLLAQDGSEMIPIRKKEVVGKVISADDGSPVVGATILIKGTTLGAAADRDGFFKLRVDENDSLTIRAVGYKPIDLPSNFSKMMELRLEPNLAVLKEVAIVGYGTQDKRDITGSISSVNKKQLEYNNELSFDNAIIGKAAGVYVSSSSGVPGSATSIVIRGITALSGDANNPLIVIDGVPIYGTGRDLNTTNFSPTSSGLTGFGGTRVSSNYSQAYEFERNPLANLNPDDIESIEILKDAYATSIYGSRGAAGVILVTTKRGNIGKPKLRVRYLTGTSAPMGRYNLLNSSEYNDIYSRFNTSRGGQPFVSEDNTDWQNEVIRPVITKDLGVSISGADDRFSYFISGGLVDQPFYIINQDFKRFTGRSNMEYKSNEIFSFGSNISISHTANDALNAQTIYRDAILKAPNLPIYNDDGEYNFGLSSNPYGINNSNPIALANNINNVVDTRTVSNFYLEVSPANWITFKSEAGFDLISSRSFSRRFSAPGFLPNGEGRESIRQNQKIVFNNLMTIKKLLHDDHFVSMVVGHSFEKSNEQFNSIFANNFPDDNLISIGASDPDSRRVTASNILKWALTSYFARLDYRFLDKYLFGATYRIDGSSRFARNARYVGFPSFSAGWRLSEESFLDNMTFITDLKLRGSIGFAGIQGGGASTYYGNQGQYQINQDSRYGNLNILSIQQPPNPNLNWQKTRTLDIGIDASLWNDRVTVIIDYYHRRTKNLLFSSSIPRFLGFTAHEQNLGDMQNSGLEFTINTAVRRGNFEWIPSFNISSNRNKVLKLNFEGEEVGFTQLGETYFKEGEPAGLFFLYQWHGVDPATGHPLWLDGDGEISTSAPEGRWRIDNVNRHRMIMGTPIPTLFGGLSNTFRYKNWELLTTFSFSYGNKMLNGSYATLMTYSTDDANNLDRDILDFWRLPGHQTSVPRLNNNSITTPEGETTAVGVDAIYDFTASRSNSRFLEDASYIRMRTLTLAYRLPKQLLLRYGNVVSNFRIFIQGTNLLTFTKYTGLDPEVSAFGSDALAGGVDELTLPQARMIQLGVNIDF